MQIKKTNIKKAEKITVAEIKDNAQVKKTLIEEQHDFYSIKLKNGKLDDISIDKVKLVKKLLLLGFCRFDTDDDKFIMVHIEDNTIKRVSAMYVRDVFFKWVDELPDLKKSLPVVGGEVDVTVSGKYIKSKMFRSIETYFGNLIYERAILPEPIVIQKDTLETKYFYFKNCFVSINKEGHHTHS